MACPHFNIRIIQRSKGQSAVAAAAYQSGEQLHSEYPHYGWDRNKGYPTALHYSALKQYGPTPVHRMTFKLKLDTATAQTKETKHDSSL